MHIRAKGLAEGAIGAASGGIMAIGIPNRGRWDSS
jgi:hypothetical protein